MPRKSPPKPDEKPQFERFIEAAKAHGADETDAELSKLVRRIAKNAHETTDTQKNQKKTR